DGAASLVELLGRARRVTGVAIALVVLTGLYNVTLLGPLDRALQSGAALLLALEFMLVLAAGASAGQSASGPVARTRRAGGAREGRGGRPAAGVLGDRVDGPHRAAARGRDHLPGARRLARLIGRSEPQAPQARCSEAGDLDSGVLQLVAPVDRGEDRGDALE